MAMKHGTERHGAARHEKHCRTRGQIIVGGDGSAIDPSTEDDLMKEIVRFAHRYARRIVSGDAAQDLAQDVALELWIKVHERRLIVREGYVAALVRHVVRRRAVDLLRDEQRAVERASTCVADEARDQSPTWMSPDLALEEHELREFHERTLVSLPATCRRAFSMVREEGARYDVAARALGVSRSAVHAHVVTAQRRFRRKLAQIGIAAPMSRRGAA